MSVRIHIRAANPHTFYTFHSLSRHTSMFSHREKLIYNLNKCSSVGISPPYVADVVGVALGLDELGDVMRQRVLLMDCLQTSLVEQLQGKKSKKVRRSKNEKTIFSKVIFLMNRESDGRLTSLLCSWLTLACIMTGWSSIEVKGILSGCCLYFLCRKQVDYTTCYVTYLANQGRNFTDDITHNWWRI